MSQQSSIEPLFLAYVDWFLASQTLDLAWTIGVLTTAFLSCVTRFFGVEEDHGGSKPSNFCAFEIIGLLPSN